MAKHKEIFLRGNILDQINEMKVVFFEEKKKRIEKNITGRNTVKLTEHYAKS